MRRWLVLCLLAGCGPRDARDVRLELLTRVPSCPQSTTTFDISCVQALTVRVVGGDGTRYRSQCTVLGGRYASLQDLIASQQVIQVLEDVRARNDVRVELRAYKNGGADPCAAPSDDDLMFWGSSELVNLGSDSLAVLNVTLECRPECDCADLGADPGKCPEALPVGACAPAANRACRRTCDSDEECFSGAVACTAGVCDGGLPSDTCCATPRGMCAACNTGQDCDSGVCVENTQTSEHFCADPCPPLPSVYPCTSSSLMSCKRLGGTFQRLP